MTLATLARVEFEDRVARYPELVRRGLVEAELAERDTECWNTIAAALEGIIDDGRLTIRFDPLHPARIRWQELIDALDRANVSRARACEKYPDDGTLAARREAVHYIDQRIRWRIEFWIDFNRELTERADAQRAATRKAA